jgi:hypothetical protein
VAVEIRGRILADVFSSADGFFFSPAAELLGRAGRKILESGGRSHCIVHPLFSRDLRHSFAEKLGCWKKISAAFRKVPKNGVFFWNRLSRDIAPCESYVRPSLGLKHLFSFLKDMLPDVSLLMYRVAAIFPEHFQSFTIALKNHIFHGFFRA